MSVTVTGMEKVRREIDGFRKRLKLSEGEFADLAAQTVRDTVVRNAQPFGMGKKAMERGRNAVRKDLLKIFTVVPDSARVSRGVVGSVGEARRWHKNRRGSRGRTTAGRKKRVAVSVFRDYFDEVAAKVGRAKGSVMGGGESRLKGRFSKWVKRWKGEGSAKRRRSLKGTVWKFSAEPRHVASNRVLGDRGVSRVMRAKERNLRNRLRREVQREMKRAERRVNG